MDNYKRVYAQPIITLEDVYTLEVFLPRKGKELVYHMTVKDSTGDLIICEKYKTTKEWKDRIIILEFELQKDLPTEEKP